MRRPKKKITIDRDRQALDLRKAGASYDQIARQLGYFNRGGAFKAVARGLDTVKHLMVESAEDVRSLELTRLDALLLGIWQAATSGDVQAVTAALRIAERRAAYLGLDAPKRQELTGADGGPIEVEQNVTYSVEERQRRIVAIVDAARGRPDLPALTAGSDLDTSGGSADTGVA
jgi:hypothetical protein